MFFSAGCNEQVFPPRPWKKFWRRTVLQFLTKIAQLRCTTIPIKMTSPSRRLRWPVKDSYSNHLQA